MNGEKYVVTVSHGGRSLSITFKDRGQAILNVQEGLLNVLDGGDRGPLAELLRLTAGAENAIMELNGWIIEFETETLGRSKMDQSGSDQKQR